MPEHYKLRLRDGTLLFVDRDGLNTWLLDDKALVQPVGSRRWRPLKQLLAEEERASARSAVRPRTPPEAPASPSQPADAPSIGEPLSVQTLADDTAAPLGHGTSRQESQPADELPIIPLKPLEPPKPLDHETPPRLAAVSSPRLPEPPSIVAPPSVQTLADDTTFRSARDTSPRKPEPHDELPIIPLKPLDGKVGASPHATTWRPVPAEEQDAVATETPRTGGFVQNLLATVTTWFELFADQIHRRFRRERALPSSFPNQTPTPSGAAGTGAPGTSGPPISFSELPVLRFADTHDAETDTAGHDVYQQAPLAGVVWLWMKRVVLFGGLAVGGVFAAQTWETWFPKAQQLGLIIFSEIDKHTQSSAEIAMRSQALLAATEQLPHLAPETIRLVMAGSVTGALDPPEVFHRAYDAEERGMPALTPEEAGELNALRRSILTALRPAEQATVRDYDRVRTHRATFPFEDRKVLDLFARSVSALPVESRERLRALSAKAVAAGLRLQAAAAPGPRRDAGGDSRRPATR